MVETAGSVPFPPLPPGSDAKTRAKIKPLRPWADTAREIIITQGSLPGSGALVIGDKGKLFAPDDYGAHVAVAMKG